MKKNFPNIINAQQHRTAEGFAEALEYHYCNFKEHEKERDARKCSFEAQAYISQLGKFSFYLFYIEKKLHMVEPSESELKKMWISLHRGGCLNALRNKWSSHRSVDYREKDLIGTHSFVVSNLDDLRVSMWTSDGEYELNFVVEKSGNTEPCCVVLSQEHPKIMNFFSWFFREIEFARDIIEQESESR